MSNTRSFRGGYTFFELITVIGITIIFGSVALLNLPTGLRTKTEIDNALLNLKAHLLIVQQRSMTQENGQQWGIHFDASTPGNHFYQIFYGDSYETGTIVETIYLPDGIIFLSPVDGTTDDIIFEKVTGKTEDGHSIIIGLEELEQGGEYSDENTSNLVVAPETGLVQQLESVPDFNTSISLNPSSATMQAGASVQSTVSLNILSGISEVTAFSATGLPTQTTAQFSPVSCSPTCSSVMTIQTGASTPNGTHIFTVTATAGSLVKSTNFSLTISTQVAPGAPENLSLIGGSGQVSLSWQAPTFTGGSAITNYKIYRGLSSGNLTHVADAGVSLSYINSGLNNGTTYYYKVSAVNSTGEGAQSSESSVALSATPPGIPVNLSGEPAANRAILNWEAPTLNGGSALSEYRIYRSATSGGSLTQVGTVAGDVLTYTNTGLSAGSTYYYKVSAVNSVGEGSLSSEVSVALPATPPSAPTNFSGTGGDSQAVLNWSAPVSDGGSAITNYKVYRSTTSGGTLTLIATVGDVLTYTNTGLTNGTTYYYKISAVNTAGEGVLTSEVSVAVSGASTAPTVTSVTALFARVQIKWTTPTSNGGNAITGYKVYRSTTAGNSSPTLVATTGLVLQYLDSTAANETTYYYKVKATNAAGDSVFSNELSGTPSNFSSAFITSSAYNGNLGGLTGADAKCQTAADTAGIGGTWKAWISDSGTSASSRLRHGAAPYKMLNGSTLATNWSTLADSSMTIAFNITEYGTAVTGQPYGWTNTRGDGSIARASTAVTCNNWTSSTGSGAYGFTGSLDETWTAFMNYNRFTGWTPSTSPCNISGGYHLYCIEQTPQAPSAPGNLTLTNGDQSITLSWTAPSDNGGSAITGYQIYRGTSSGNLQLVDTIDNILTYTDENLTAGVTYYYQVIAVNSAGSGSQSSESSLVAYAAPSAPSKLVAYNEMNGSSRVIYIQWTKPVSNGGQPVQYYKIYRGTTSGNLQLIGTTENNYANRVFVTSSTYNGNLGGLAGADAKCQAAADTAKIGGTTWKAWISDGTASAATRLNQFNGPYYLVNGRKIANNWSDLTNGGLNLSIDISETGSTVSNAEVWTGSYYNGGYSGASCTNWTSSSWSILGNTGLNSAVNSVWTNYRQNWCGYSMRLYCIEQSYPGSAALPIYGGGDGTGTLGNTYYYKVSAVTSIGEGALSEEVGITFEDSANVFVTSAAYNGNLGGMAGANAKCQVAADTNLSQSQTQTYRTWRAWLSSNPNIDPAPTDAMFRTVFPFKLLNGTKIANNWLDLTDGSLIHGIDVDETGTVKSSDAHVWTNTDYRGNYLGSTESYTCNFWTSTLNYSYFGLLKSTDATWSTQGHGSYFGPTTLGCWNTANLYCIEQKHSPPGAPTNFIAATGANQISLSWTHPVDMGSGISGYKLYRSLTSGGTLNLVATLEWQNSYIDTGLSSGTTYYYKLSAFNEIGEGSRTSESTATTYSAPGVPQNLSASSGVSQVNLSWSAPASSGGSAVTGYKVYRTVSGTESLIASPAGLSYTDSSVSSGVSYTYKVSAVSVIGEGEKSAGVTSGSMLTESASYRRTFVTSTSYSANQSGGTGDFDSACQVRATAGNLGGTWISWTSGASDNIFDRLYHHQVPIRLLNNTTVADNWADLIDGAIQSPINFNELGVPDNSGTVWTGTDGGGISTGSNCANWDSSYGGYSGTSGVTDNAGGGWTNIRVQTCSNAYKLYCFEQGGPAVPDAPTGFSGSAASSYVAVNLSWSIPYDGNSSITGFNIYRGTTSGGQGLFPIANVSPSATTYSDTGLTAGSTYYYKISAVNAVGESVKSSEISVPLIPPTPGAPTSVTANSGYNAVSLGWSASDPNGGPSITQYRIYRSSSSGGTFTQIGSTADGSTTGYSDNSAILGATNYYKVKAYNGFNESAFSNEASNRYVFQRTSGSGNAGETCNAWLARTSQAGSPFSPCVGNSSACYGGESYTSKCVYVRVQDAYMYIYNSSINPFDVYGPDYGTWYPISEFYGSILPGAAPNDYYYTWSAR